MKTTVHAQTPYLRTTVSADVDIELSPAELREEGWHHESECMGTTPAVSPLPGGDRYQDAIASLHRQAHPGQPADPAACREEPCRSMPLASLVTRMGRTA